jgi:hypothetical protein
VTARRPSHALLALAALLAVLAAGCGGGDGGAAGSDAAAEAVPASALAYVSVNSDLESGQWDKLRDHVDRFPDSSRLVDKLLEELADEGVDWERDVEPAVGPEVAIAAVDVDDDPEPEPVFLTKPDDVAKLDALLDRADDEEATVRKEITGWQVVAESTAQLEAFERALDAGNLADDEDYTSAVAELPEEALVSFYVDGDAVTELARREGQTAELPGFGRLRSLVGAAEAVDEGLEFEGTLEASGGDALRSYTPTLLERVPSGVFAAASFSGAADQLNELDEVEGLDLFIPKLERELGVTLGDLAELLSGEGVFYARRAAALFPELTLLVRVDDEARARTTLERLGERLADELDARTGETTLDGEPAAFVVVEGVRFTYGVADGIATVTSARSLSPPPEGERLADDAEFSDAKEASGLGEETAGFLYVNLEDTIELVESVADMQGEEVPPELARNLRPLRTLISHVSRDGDRLRFASLLTVE